MPYLHKGLIPYSLLFLLFIAAVIFRPLLPVDETRYLTVAWEMYLQNNFLKLSLNFEPYHHKPPLLFWLINISWHIFGVSREAAMVPIFLASAATLALTRYLTKMTFGEKAAAVSSYILLGSIPFIAYSTMIMFDMTVTAFILCYHICLIKNAQNPKPMLPVLSGLALGFAILAKGPVAFVYILGPVIFYSFWRKDSYIVPAAFYRAFAISLVVAILPVLAWLAPLAVQSDQKFLWWLLWEQSAGRVTGNFNAAHARPFYFYFLLIPLIILPWGFFPKVWRSFKLEERETRFLIAAILPAFLAFSCISGKQPHYLAPLIPYVTMAFASALPTFERSVRATALAMTGLFLIGHAIGYAYLFPEYDLRPYAAYYRQHADKEWAFVQNYQGEIGFLARVEKPISNIDRTDMSNWMKSHPDGYALVRYKGREAYLDGQEPLFSYPYRGKRLGVFHYNKE